MSMGGSSHVPSGDECIFYDDSRNESVDAVCEETTRCKELLKTIDGGNRTMGPVCFYSASKTGNCCPILGPKPDTYCDQMPPKPSFPSQGHKVAWTKCIQNQRQVTCKKDKDGKTVYLVLSVGCNLEFNYSQRPVRQFAGTGEFPHIASLGYKDDSPSGIAWLATGSLVSEKYILTSASVLEHGTYGSVKFALLGTSTKADTKNGKLIDISRRIAHEDYDSTTKENDIALVELVKPVSFSELIRPICLPVAGIEYGDIRHVCGWKAEREYDVTRSLMRRHFREMSPSVCTKKLRTEELVFNSKNMICASGVINDSSSETERGAPLMSKVLNSEFTCNYIINGVLSASGRGLNAPVVYTNVSNHIDWIVQNIWLEEYERDRFTNETDIKYLNILHSIQL
ncbi:chymotrypsin-like elastase family member 2A isoform X2 [Epargyreus clarus]|uniref:chymotrypsin-like elastase family member 2A isoform X2 n=1 Tax=Epargyreus clarus TaxID=520877 RepID=UPI003C2DD6D7